MNYLLDKKVKRKKFSRIAIGFFSLLFLFYFRVGIFNIFSNVFQVVFHPVVVVGNGIGNKFQSIGSYFSSKKTLYWTNQSLQNSLAADEAKMLNYNALLADNNSLKEALGRKIEKNNFVVAAILTKPNQSLYDTVSVDAGKNEGVKVNDYVFANGDIPVGYVSYVYDHSSQVILFSNPGEKTEALIPGKNTFVELTGRGGGNFEMILPPDTVFNKGDQVILPGLYPYVLAITQTVISDPRDPFSKVLLSSPANIQELKFVEIEQ